jgi:hypothetical protein
MIRFFTRHRDLSGGFSRREWLRVGGLAGLSWLGASGTPVSGASDSSRGIRGFGKARSVILVYTAGGQSQLETWDPKPDAPEVVRGEFRPIATSVPGTFVGEHLPRLARLADRYTIVRSLSHDDVDHGSACYLALTGRFHARKSSNPPPRPSDDPTYGALVQRLRPTGRFPYEAVHLNGPLLVPAEIGPGQDGGFLGRHYEPLVLGDVNSPPEAMPALAPPIDLPAARLATRERLRETLDHCRSHIEGALANGAQADMDHLYRQAFEVLASRACRQAFDLSAEPESMRDRYGRNRPGQACLLARRLVEAGVPLITVFWNYTIRGQDKTPGSTETYGWDTHNDIFEALKVHLLPHFDVGFSALLEDLDERGLLQQTLVVCMGEFGRAPIVALEPKFAGRTPGRKHWPSAYSAVLAGAGIARGAVYGATDRFAAQPRSNRVGPWDIAATMFSALGIDPATEYLDPQGRPLTATAGQPITGLYE